MSGHSLLLSKLDFVLYSLYYSLNKRCATAAVCMVVINSLGSAFLVVYLCVCHPTAGLHLVAVQPPVLQLLLEERPADVSGVVELAGPVVVQDLAEHNRVSAIVVYISSETQGTKDATVEIQMIQNL